MQQENWSERYIGYMAFLGPLNASRAKWLSILRCTTIAIAIARPFVALASDDLPPDELVMFKCADQNLIHSVFASSESGAVSSEGGDPTLGGEKTLSFRLLYKTGVLEKVTVNDDGDNTYSGLSDAGVTVYLIVKPDDPSSIRVVSWQYTADAASKLQDTTCTRSTP